MRIWTIYLVEAFRISTENQARPVCYSGQYMYVVSVRLGLPHPVDTDRPSE